MKNCDIGSPLWKHKGCPGQYDGSHICRACQVQKLSKDKTDYFPRMDIDRVKKQASFVR